MIKNNKQLEKAKEAVRNLEVILEKARKVHSPSEYKAMSEPILLEIQQRENEIIRYVISINKQWRVCFEWHESNAYNVQITDYH